MMTNQRVYQSMLLLLSNTSLRDDSLGKTMRPLMKEKFVPILNRGCSDDDESSVDEAVVSEVEKAQEEILSLERKFRTREQQRLDWLYGTR